MKSHLRFRSFILTACVCAFIGLRVNAQNLSASPARNVATPSQVSSSAATPKSEGSEAGSYVLIPGPLRSFLRMAAVSQKVGPEEVLPLLAHHIAVYGYEGSKTKAGKPTEY